MPGNEIESRSSGEGSGGRRAHQHGVCAQQRDLAAFAVCEPAKYRHGPHPAEEKGRVEQGTEVSVLLWGERAVASVDKAACGVCIEGTWRSGAVVIAEAQSWPQVELTGQGTARRPEGGRLQLVVAL